MRGRFPFCQRLLLLVCALLLSACSPIMRSDVTTFHEGPLPAGERIRIQPVDRSLAQSLEFRRYADLIAEQLQRIGYSPVSPEDTGGAELVAEVDYRIQQGPVQVRMEPPTTPFVRYHFMYGRFRDPFYFGLSRTWQPELYSVTSYSRTLQISIVKSDEKGEHLYEGRVESIGRQGNLNQVMPYLVTAMFTNYPGENGVTKVVTIEMDE